MASSEKKLKKKLKNGNELQRDGGQWNSECNKCNQKRRQPGGKQTHAALMMKLNKNDSSTFRFNASGATRGKGRGLTGCEGPRDGHPSLFSPAMLHGATVDN